MDAVTMIGLCIKHQQGETAAINTARQNEAADSSMILTPCDTALEGHASQRYAGEYRRDDGSPLP